VSSTTPARAARRRVAWQQATAAKRRRATSAAYGAIALALALFAGMILAKAATSTHTSTTAAQVAASTATTTQVVRTVTALPESVFAAVGDGGTANQAQAVTGAPALNLGGKPEVLYLGAEYCPYCAAQRWPLVLALSRFGTFTGLALTESSGTDVYPDTNTFTFLHATYRSDYLALTTVEISDRDQAPLQTPTAAQQQLLDTYGQGGIPFIDLGGAIVLRSSGYDPQLLAGKNWSAIAQTLTGDPSSPVTRAVIGTANRITAQLCALTHGQPASVCTAPEVKALETNQQEANS
jgi:hypothetical protein